MLTDMQKAKIRLYLGYPDALRYKHTRLEGSLDHLSPEAEELVTDLLTKVEAVDTALIEAGVDGAGVKRVDEIWFDNGMVRVTVVRSTGRMHVGRISIIVGVPPFSDYFGKQGYLGDSFSGPANNRSWYGIG